MSENSEIKNLTAEEFFTKEGFLTDLMLNRIYQCVAAGKIGKSLDLIYSTWMNLGRRWDLMSDILTKADMSKLEETTIACFASCTFKYIKQVPVHLEFLKRGEDHLLSQGVSKEEIAEIFAGFYETGDYWKSMAGIPSIISGVPPED